MNVLHRIIESLTKEESRYYKLFAARTNNNSERKDTQLFDFIKKNGEDYNEEEISNLLYGDNKNSFYQLKNRVFKDLNKSMMLQHMPKERDIFILHFVLLSRVYMRKGDVKLSFYYLNKAEKEALKIESYKLLDIIYSEILELSYGMVSINAEEYIKKQRENKIKRDQIQEIDLVIAAVRYRVKTSQNFSGKNLNIIEILQKTVTEFSQDKNTAKSPKFQMKIYQAVSRILLQKHDFEALENYLLHTFNSFIKNKIFTKTNHEHKLMMISYITNCLFKTGKLKKSLEYAEILKESVEEYDGFLKDKYIFYYYNALVINYSKLDKKQALRILDEVKGNEVIKQLPTYTVFIYLNTALIHFDLGNYKEANKNLSRLLLQKDFDDIARSFQLKIHLAELIVRYMVKDFDTCEIRIDDIHKKYSGILNSEGLYRDKEMLDIIRDLMCCNNLRQDKKLTQRISKLSLIITDKQAEDADVINYNIWLKSLLK